MTPILITRMQAQELVEGICQEARHLGAPAVAQEGIFGEGPQHIRFGP